jgi:hypothetical protein
MKKASKMLKRRGRLAAVMIMVCLLSLVSHSRVQGMVVFNRCPIAQDFFSTVCWMTPARASLAPLPRARLCERFSGQLTCRCGSRSKWRSCTEPYATHQRRSWT